MDWVKSRSGVARWDGAGDNLEVVLCRHPHCVKSGSISAVN